MEGTVDLSIQKSGATEENAGGKTNLAKPNVTFLGCFNSESKTISDT
jgi:hypothetical protein